MQDFCTEQVTGVRVVSEKNRSSVARDGARRDAEEVPFLGALAICIKFAYAN